MSLNFDKYAELFTGGEPAGNFNKKVIVYSEMAVRTILLNFERELTKNLQQADSPDAEIRADCGYLDDTCADCENEDCPIVSRRR